MSDLLSSSNLALSHESPMGTIRSWFRTKSALASIIGLICIAVVAFVITDVTNGQGNPQKINAKNTASSPYQQTRNAYQLAYQQFSNTPPTNNTMIPVQFPQPPHGQAWGNGQQPSLHALPALPPSAPFFQAHVTTPEEAAANQRVMELVNKIQQSAESDREELTKQLRGFVEEQFAIRHQEQAKQIKELEAQLQKAKDIHKKRSDKKDEIVDRRMAELLQSPDDLEWNRGILNSGNRPPQTPRNVFVPNAYSPAEVYRLPASAYPSAQPYPSPNSYPAPQAPNGSLFREPQMTPAQTRRPTSNRSVPAPRSSTAPTDEVEVDVEEAVPSF